MNEMMGSGTNDRLLWALIAITILALAVLTTYRLARRPITAEPTPRIQPPEEVLRRRYAEGEIDEDEYLKRQAGLR
ncbi:putative membrane protein [Kribbella aluminosa]|uniref:Membrane protein n=1 Tax=Kribbella aluminosa TaxID=416017 RepID=A0ABS4UBK8_9ACTN|nr:SHOCT domain-containing protein [Kribbella aluminosa]MBP2349024.1 putative membrane protein [Kribbella aluminosa]